MLEWSVLPAAIFAALVGGWCVRRIHDGRRRKHLVEWAEARSMRYESPGQNTIRVDWGPLFDELPGRVVIEEAVQGQLLDREGLLCSLRIQLPRNTVSLSVIAVREGSQCPHFRVPALMKNALGVDVPEESTGPHGSLGTATHKALLVGGRLDPASLNGQVEALQGVG